MIAERSKNDHLPVKSVCQVPCKIQYNPISHPNLVPNTFPHRHQSARNFSLSPQSHAQRVTGYPHHQIILTWLYSCMRFCHWSRSVKMYLSFFLNIIYSTALTLVFIVLQQLLSSLYKTMVTAPSPSQVLSLSDSNPSISFTPSSFTSFSLGMQFLLYSICELRTTLPPLLFL